VGTRPHTSDTRSTAKAVCLWMCPVPCEISAVSMPAVTAAVASSAYFVACCLKRRPLGRRLCQCRVVGVRHRCAYLRVVGEECPRACAVGRVPLALPELECAAILVEAPF
jgi:hypothetical protein